MTTDKTSHDTSTPNTKFRSPEAADDKISSIEQNNPKKNLSPAAKRALAEAETRRKARDAQKNSPHRELGGRGGADPARYGDWEINGRAIDF